MHERCTLHESTKPDPNPKIELTFDLSEEIAEIALFEADVIGDVMRRLRTPYIGPVIRLAKASGLIGQHLVRLAEYSNRVRAVIKAIDGDYRRSTSLDPRRWEVVKIPPTGGDEDPFWQAFVWRLRRGGCEAGVSAGICDTFAHAMIELAENTIEHSEHPGTGLAYYEALADRYEFGIADSGIGIRSSLNRNKHYARLEDDLVAIRSSLEDGVSRFDEEGRGWGFRTVLRALRNSGSQAVVRSGTAGLRVHPRNGAHDRIGFQRGYYEGVWIGVSAPTIY